jgi:hypothetical protein
MPYCIALFYRLSAGMHLVLPLILILMRFSLYLDFAREIIELRTNRKNSPFRTCLSLVYNIYGN